MKQRHGTNGAMMMGVAAWLAALAAGGCAAKVNQDVYEQDIAGIRSQIDELDGRVNANRSGIESNSVRLDALQADLEGLREDFDVAVTRFEDGIRFATPVHFDFDRAEIRPADHELLDRFAGIVGDHYRGAMITVEGFADPAGSAAYNRALSERRAQSVASYLQSEGGLSGDMLRTVGYGEDRQVVPGARGPGEEGLENRRVAFVIEYAPSSGASPAVAARSEG